MRTTTVFQNIFAIILYHLDLNKKYLLFYLRLKGLKISVSPFEENIIKENGKIIIL